MGSGVGESSSTGERRGRTLSKEEAFPDNMGITESKYELLKSNKPTPPNRMLQSPSAATLERKKQKSSR
jgi:hypothetical protein